MKQTRIILLFAALLALCSCSTTKRIPEGEQLYTGVKKFTIITPDSTGKVVPGVDASLRKQVAVAPNNAIFSSPYYRWPFPMGLWVWNNWNDPGHGLKHWLYDKLVAEPVLINDVRPAARVKMLENVLADNGYFRGGASYEIIPNKKNPRKAKVSYNVATGPAYTFSQVQLLPDTCTLHRLIDSIAVADPYPS